MYESKEKSRDNKIQETLPIDALIPKKNKLEEELDKIDPLETTPMDALNILYKLKKLSKKTNIYTASKKCKCFSYFYQKIC